jgi:hypothetical protein
MKVIANCTTSFPLLLGRSAALGPHRLAYAQWPRLLGARWVGLIFHKKSKNIGCRFRGRPPLTPTNSFCAAQAAQTPTERLIKIFATDQPILVRGAWGSLGPQIREQSIFSDALPEKMLCRREGKSRVSRLVFLTTLPNAIQKPCVDLSGIHRQHRNIPERGLQALWAYKKEGAVYPGSGKPQT